MFKMRNWLKKNILFKILKKYRKFFIETIQIARLEKKFSCKIERFVKLEIDNFDNLNISKNVYIGAFTTIHVKNDKNKSNSFLEIGESTSIGELNNIRASGGRISIGKKCLISQHVSIVVANHSSEKGKFIMDQPWSLKKNYITIGDDVWIGVGAIILPGVTIGSGAIIGAGSIVTKDVDENSIVYGSQSNLIKQRV